MQYRLKLTTGYVCVILFMLILNLFKYAYFKLLRGSRPKSTWANPQYLAHNVPDFIQIGSLSAEL